MLSNIEHLDCDACGHRIDASEFYYSPIGSQYAVRVYQCSKCNFIQSFKFSSREKLRKTTSTDADWGNVRHGKSLRLDVLREHFDLESLISAGTDVLDIGSNRGDFLEYCDSITGPTARLVGVEPDTNVVPESFKDHSRVEIIKKRYEDASELQGECFNFIYSCQTLEHADSANEMLMLSAANLSPSGFMLIDIPNTAVITTRTMEEYFIDKHKFHFTARSLKMMLASCGLHINRCLADNYNISVLVSKIPNNSHESLLSDQDLNLKDVAPNYRHTIEEERRVLRSVVAEKITPMLGRQKVTIWGAGRHLDALIKYAPVS